MKARARIPESPYKSKLEARYAERLEAMKRAGEILDWRYEPWRLRLGNNSNYTPDFLTVELDGTFLLHEVKGYSKNMRQSRTAWKAAAEMNPWLAFCWCTWKNGSWLIETY